MASLLKYVKRDTPAERKTPIYDVFNVKTGENLAIIGFYPAWRKFVSEAQPYIVFDANCYRELADFLDKLTTSWRMNQL
jgi:hypothetical protein